MAALRLFCRVRVEEEEEEEAEEEAEEGVEEEEEEEEAEEGSLGEKCTLRDSEGRLSRPPPPPPISSEGEGGLTWGSV